MSNKTPEERKRRVSLKEDNPREEKEEHNDKNWVCRTEHQKDRQGKEETEKDKNGKEDQQWNEKEKERTE